MNIKRHLIESLAKLKRELPNINPICYSCKKFNQENIQQAHTIL